MLNIVSSFSFTQKHYFIYIRGRRAVGFASLHRIDRAYHIMVPPMEEVLELASRPCLGIEGHAGSTGTKTLGSFTPPSRPGSQSRAALCLEPESQPASLGVSQIWVHPNVRRGGIARTLILHAALNFFPYPPQPVPLQQVSFYSTPFFPQSDLPPPPSLIPN